MEINWDLQHNLTRSFVREFNFASLTPINTEIMFLMHLARRLRRSPTRAALIIDRYDFDDEVHRAMISAADRIAANKPPIVPKQGIIEP